MHHSLELKLGLLVFLSCLVAGCSTSKPVRWQARQEPPTRRALPKFDPQRIERVLVRGETLNFLTQPEQQFVAAREAYWNYDTDAAVAGFRQLMTVTNMAFSSDALPWLIIKCLEEAGRWSDAAAAYREFGLAAVRRTGRALAEAMALQPVRTIHFDPLAPPVTMELARDHLVLIRGRLNGRTARFLVDTGFSRSLVAGEFAPTYGLTLLDATVRVTDANESRRTARMVLADEISFGGLTAHHVPMVVGSMKSFRKFIGDVDGVIGWDLLQQADVSFDFPGRQMTVRAPAGGPIAEPTLAGRHAPLLTFVSPEGHPLDLFLDSGYASKPPTLDLFTNAELIASKLALDRFHWSWRPRFSFGLHSFSMNWPRRARGMPVWFANTEITMPMTLLQREIDVHEGLVTCDGVVGNAPFLSGTLRLSGRERRATFAAPASRDAAR